MNVGRRVNLSYISFNICILLALYFMSYRYPLQIGSSATSPTYSDTPAWLSGIKYIILCFVIFPIFFNFRNIFSIYWYSFVLLLMIYPFAIGVIVFDYGFPDGIRLVQISFTFFCIFPAILGGYFGRKLRAFEAKIVYFFWICVIFETIQLFLYFSTGRLPSLGYYGGSVRFGAVWDDPNSFPAILAFIAPYTLASHAKIYIKFIILSICIILLALTQSLTSIITFPISLTIIFVIFSYLSARNIGEFISAWLLRTFVIFLVSSLVGTIMYASGAAESLYHSYGEWYVSKQASVEARSGTYIVVNQIDALTLLGINPVGQAGENTYLNVIANMGIPYFLLLISFFIIVIYISYRNLIYSFSCGGNVPVFMGICGFVTWFCLTGVNIPVLEVYPVNVLFGLISGLTIVMDRQIRMNVVTCPR